MYAARTRAALGVAVTLGGLTMVGATVPAQAQGVTACHAGDLAISKGRLDAGASQRYQNIRIKNVSDSACRLTGFPTFAFHRLGTPIGWKSTPQVGTPAATTVVIRAGRTAYTTLHWTDPGPIPANECRARMATGVTMTLPARSHVYRIVLSAKVCTTKQYRPSAYPIRAARTV